MLYPYNESVTTCHMLSLSSTFEGVASFRAHDVSHIGFTTLPVGNGDVDLMQAFGPLDITMIYRVATLLM